MGLGLVVSASGFEVRVLEVRGFGCGVMGFVVWDFRCLGFRGWGFRVRGFAFRVWGFRGLHFDAQS